MSDEIPRNKYQTFINTAPKTTADYAELNDGVETGKIDMNADTQKSHYIGNANGSFSVTGYAPSMKITHIAKVGDDAYDFIASLLVARAIGSDAETDVVNVRLWETPQGNEYPAERQPVVIEFTSHASDGGKPYQIEYTISYNGDPVAGTFNPTSVEFTEDGVC